MNITVNTLGEVIYRDRNTAVCIPSEPAAGFTEPFVDTLNVDHVSGIGRIEGHWKINVFNKHHVNLGHEYEISFTDDAWLEERTLTYLGGTTTGIRCMNLTTGDTLYDMHFPNAKDFRTYGYPELERGIFEGLHFGFNWPLLSGEKDRGVEIIKKNPRGRDTNEWKRWATDSRSNLRVEQIDLSKSDSAYPLPVDVEIRIADHVGVDTSVTTSPLLIKTYPLNFTTWDVSDPDNPRQLKIIMRYDKTPGKSPEEMYGQIWDSTRVIISFTNTVINRLAESWSIYFFKSQFDTLNPVIPAAPGDIYRFKTIRTPTRYDTLRFKVEGGEWSKDMAAEKMRNIFVVPDPYVVSSNYEPYYELAGQNQRRVDFVNLPPRCKIRIFTASGKLVKTIQHEALEDFGRHSWDLTTEDGPEIAFGMYFFVVESPGIGTKSGKFAVIK
jgi:hypothetical protein